jgi:hypothetical protein
MESVMPNEQELELASLNDGAAVSRPFCVAVHCFHSQ